MSKARTRSARGPVIPMAALFCTVGLFAIDSAIFAMQGVVV